MYWQHSISSRENGFLLLKYGRSSLPTLIFSCSLEYPVGLDWWRESLSRQMISIPAPPPRTSPLSSCSLQGGVMIQVWWLIFAEVQSGIASWTVWSNSSPNLGCLFEYVSWKWIGGGRWLHAGVVGMGEGSELGRGVGNGDDIRYVVLFECD